MKPNHSYYQGAALADQTVKPMENVKRDLVCSFCGADEDMCHHAIDNDYALEDREFYEACTTFYRRFLYFAGVVLVVCVVVLVSLAGR